MLRIYRTLRKLLTSSRQGDEHGQAIVLIGVTGVVLLAFAGLAIDGGRLYFLKRDSQNAADAGAIAAARALCTVGDYEKAGYDAVNANGFDNNGETNAVTVVSPPQHATKEIPPECQGCYVEVYVTGRIPASFTSVVLDGPLSASSYAIGTCNPDTTFGFDPEGLRALWSGSTTCQNTVDFTGASNAIWGGIHSNKDIHSGGGGEGLDDPTTGTGQVVGPVSYVGEVNIPEGKIDFVTEGEVAGGHRYTVSGACDISCFADLMDDGTDSAYPFENPFKSEVIDYPLDYELSDFQAGGEWGDEAIAAGEYHYFDICRGPDKSMGPSWLTAEGLLDGDGNLAPGLYYSECDIDINVNNLKGNVTLVAAGQIQLMGANHDLDAYSDGLLAFTPDGQDRCTAKVIKFSGSTNDWTGNIYAPHGRVEMSASSNTTTQGCVIAHSINFSGSSQSIVCNPDSDTAMSPGIWLSE